MRPLSLAFGGTASRRALAGAAASATPSKVLLRGERSARGSFRFRLPLDRPPPLGLEIALTLLVLAGAAGYGAIRGGQFDAFATQYGGVGDVAARALGFGVDIVTVSGAAHMSEPRILAIAGISGKDYDIPGNDHPARSEPLRQVTEGNRGGQGNELHRENCKQACFRRNPDRQGKIRRHADKGIDAVEI